MNFNQFLTHFGITLFFFSACYGMEKAAQNPNLSKLEAEIPINSLSAELIVHIANFLIKPADPLHSMRNLHNFARTSKFNYSIIKNLFGIAKLENQARKEKQYRSTREQQLAAMLASSSWKNWN